MISTAFTLLPLLLPFLEQDYYHFNLHYYLASYYDNNLFTSKKWGYQPTKTKKKKKTAKGLIVHWVILLFIMAAGDQKSAPLRLVSATWRVSSIGTRQSPLLLSNTSFLDASVSPPSPPSCVTFPMNKFNLCAIILLYIIQLQILINDIQTR